MLSVRNVLAVFLIVALGQNARAGWIYESKISLHLPDGDSAVLKATIEASSVSSGELNFSNVTSFAFRLVDFTIPSLSFTDNSLSDINFSPDNVAHVNPITGALITTPYISLSSSQFTILTTNQIPANAEWEIAQLGYNPPTFAHANWTVTSVPEPNSLVLVGVGVLFISAVYRQRLWRRREPYSRRQ
jgi:hypothetical protein